MTYITILHCFYVIIKYYKTSNWLCSNVFSAHMPGKSALPRHNQVSLPPSQYVCSRPWWRPSSAHLRNRSRLSADNPRPGPMEWDISYIYITDIWIYMVYLGISWRDHIEIIPYHLRSMIHYRSDPFFVLPVLPCLASVCLSRSRCGFDSITSLKISVRRNHKVVRVEGWNISLLN